MERQQYIQDLVNQNLTDEEIFAKLDEFDNDTDPPKKTTDPVKTETSTGSISDMVSNLGDFSSESSIENPFDIKKEPTQKKQSLYGFEVEDDKPKNQAKSRKDMDYSAEETKALEFIDKVDKGEIGNLPKELEKIPDIIKEEFELKEKTYYSSTGPMPYGQYSPSQKVSETKLVRSINAIKAIEKAEKQFEKQYKIKPTEDQALYLARQIRQQELKEDFREKELEKAIADKEGDMSAFLINNFGLSPIPVKREGERADFEKAIKSVRSKQKTAIEDVEDLKLELAQLNYTKNALEKKNGKDISKWSEQDIKEYKRTLEYIQEDSNNAVEKISKIQSNIDDFKSFEQELDLAKREYDIISKTSGTLKAATEELGGGLLYAGELVYDVGLKLTGYSDEVGEEKTFLARSGDFLFKQAENVRGQIAKPKEFENINNVTDFLDWASMGFVNNAPQLGLNYATLGGYGGLIALGSMSAGQKYAENLKDENLSQYKRLGTAIAYGGIELASEKVTQNLFLKSFGSGKLTKSALSVDDISGVAGSNMQLFKSKIKKAIESSPLISLSGGEAFVEEGGSEFFAQVGGNLIDKYVLDKKDVNIFDGTAESTLMGGMIGSGISLAPQIGAHVVAPFVENNDKAIQKELNSINELNKQLIKTNNTESRIAIANKILQLQESIDKRMLKGVQTLYGLNSSDIREAHDIYNELKEVEQQYREVSKDNNIDQSQKEFILSELSNEYKDLQSKRNDIIKKGNDAVENSYKYQKRVNAVKNIVNGLNDIELVVAKNAKEAEELASKYESETSETLSDKDGYIITANTGQQRIIINEQVALQNERINVAGHELLHGVLFATVRNNINSVKGLEQALREEINKIDKSLLEEGELKQRLDLYDNASKAEETLTLFFDAVAEGKINLNESKTDIVGNQIRRVLQSIPGFSNVKFDTSKDVLNFIKDFNASVERGKLTRAQKKLAKEGAKGTIVDVKPETKEATLTPETEGLAVAASKSQRATVLEEINNLIPEGIETKEQFLSDRSFTKIYESAMNPGGAINNYIKSRTTSAMEAELAIDSVLERLMNFDPQAKRKDGSIIGREGFGEFVFANTAFGKLDAKKKLFQESERRSKETSIDESTKQIADVETAVEEQVETKEKPKINPLKFTGVPSDIKLSDKPGKGLTFKKVAKQYAGEVGEQAIGIPAKKITESAANLGSVNEARAIQQFFFKADNLDKFVKILPETNIALPETQIGIETIDVSKGVQGTGLGLPKRILDYFYEDFIDPTGKLTSPKGRSKGLTSQTAVKRLKPEFRGVVSKETIDKIKKDIGITPKGELNILPKGELRSPIGQLLKGMAKTYSTLAANTLVRQEMEAAGATKQEVADVAAGKPRIMLSDTPKKVAAIAKKDMLATRVEPEVTITTSKISRIQARINSKLKPNPKDTDDPKAIYDRDKALPDFVRSFPGETVLQGVSRVLNKFLDANPKFHEIIKNSSTFGLDRSIFMTKEGWSNNIVLDESKLKRDDQVITGNYSYTKKKLLTQKYIEESKKPDFVELEFKRFEDMIDFFKAISEYLKEPGNENDFWAFQEFIRQATDWQGHMSRSSFPRLVYEIDPKTNKPILVEGVEEHFTPQNLIATLLLGGVKNGYLKEAIDIAKALSMQGFISKELDDMVNVKYKKTPPEELLDRLEDIITGKLKLDQGLASIIRYTESDIDLNRLFYVPANKTLGEYFFDSKSVPVKVQKEMMRKLFSGDTTLDQMRKYGAKYAETTVEKVKASKSNISKTPSGIISKASKTNDQILNNLNNYDKALRNARNVKAPIKGISVFDFDDTLATTKSMVGVTMPDGTETKIDATEFAKTGEDLLEQGATFDFSDFSKVVSGEPGPLIAKLDKAIKKFGNKDVFVLTARPANSASAIYEFLKGLGYEIPLENITGLANSSPEAKAQWMVDKAAEGYNDFYFTDDAYKNVKAVQDAMKVLDVKSKERIVYKDAYEKLDREFNDILEAKTGIASEKRYSDAKAEVIGVSKGKFNFFISPSAEDFVGLLYSTLSKGKLGENQMAWYKKNLLDPYTRAMNNIANERMALSADYKALKKQLGVVPKKLKQKIKGEGFNKEQAVRIYIWNKQGFDVPGLSKTDLADMTKYVENDATLQVFADQLVEITKGDGYAAPGESWMAGSITTDLLSTLQVTKRAKHLEEWQQNVDVIFSKENLNKMEAAYGSTYRGAMENMLQRMKSGKNRNFDGDSLTGKFLDWVNGSTGAIMFFNTRSAVLQTISAVNFINWSDNNVFKASAAFANQKQYWKDFMFLFNSDFLKERRDNLTINVNEADIAEMANKGGAKGALAYLLQKGFLPTQIADGFAIASGGSTFYRNRIKTYLKEGMSEKEAETKAFEDFREAAEESQQSSRPDRISQQQAGPLGRVVLAFANTPSQYARIIKKASLDLANNRGDFKTNLSKIMYYSIIQGVIFTSLQSALFAADFDDEEEMEDRIWKMSNSVVDGIMRGAGVQGAVTSVVKNATLKAIEESEKKSPKYNKVVNEIVRISPPVSSKISKLQQAAREVQWNREEMETKGFSLDNPAWLAAGNVISATTNVPADRVIKKINNVDYALSQELELYERLALLGGWQKWELGLDKKEKKEKGKSKSKFNEVKYGTTKYRTIKYK
jgi:hypothetical protein